MPVYKLRRGTKVRSGDSPTVPIMAPSKGGVGTELASMFDWIKRLRPDKACQCADRAAELDTKGIAYCEQNQPALVEMLRLGAQELALPFFELPARHAIRIAINRAKAKANSG